MQTRNMLIFAAVIALVLSCISTLYRHKAMRYLNVKFEIQVETPLEKPIFQIFYDIGKGFREKDSQSFWLKKEEQFQPIFCRVPATELKSLRFDVINGPGNATMKKIQVTSNTNQVIFSDLDEIEMESNQMDSLTIENTVVTLRTTESAFDPYFILPFPAPLSVDSGNQAWQHLFFALKIFSIVFITLATTLFLTRPKNN